MNQAFSRIAAACRFVLLVFVVCLFYFVLRPSSFVLAEDAPPIDPLKADAQLASVFFVDALNGWAVGDRGVIWHTDDGGMKWELQASTVDCRLSSIQFMDANNGWAVGGSTQPYTHATTGVVLKTHDGGQHWAAEPTWMLPTLDQIRFVDPRRGWGIGRSSSQFPSGLFATERGGRDWTPLVGEGTSLLAWTAAEMFDSRNGVAAARDGTLALVRGQSLESVRAPQLGLRAARQIKRLDAKNGWLAGDGGLVLRTNDAGRTWLPPPRPLPKSAEQFDFAALAAHGDKIILAGTPGSRVFTSSDRGRTWIDYPTGQNLPIRAVDFIDDDRGWAGGDLGLVMATRDGGRSWKRQQSGGVRAAVLGIFCEPDDVPLELFARVSVGEGYLSHVAIVNRGDLENPVLSSATLPERTQEALAGIGSAGADTAWQFPVRNRQLALPARQFVASWDEQGDGSAKLDAYLVRLIRTWRPDVIVTHDANPRGDDPVAYLINQAVLRAVDAAAAPTESPETAAGLEPWAVKKVYGTLPPGQGGGTNVAATEMAPRSGRSLAELTWQARGLINTVFTAAPASVGFRPLVNRLPQEAGRSDILVGIPDGRGESRRRPGEAPRENVDVLRRAAQKRRNLQAMLARSIQDPTAAARWMGGMSDLVGDLDETTAGEFTFQLAQRLFRTGHWELAAETFALLPKRYPKHPLTPAAMVWLVQYYSSGEVTTRITAQPQFGLVATAGRPAPNPAATTAVVPVTAELPAAKVDAPSGSQTAAKRMAEAVRYGGELEKISPAAYAEPQVKLSLASAARNGGATEAERNPSALLRGRPPDAWLASAQGEEWLARRRGTAPKEAWLCAKATSKPRLDGRLDDEIWEQAKSIDLHSPRQDDADWPASAMLARDDEFLYLAVRCRQAPGVQYAAGDGTRSRDADLSRRDRIELLIDVDRDYATYYRLSIDHRGWTRDECWGDATWNPGWYVAAGADDDTWTVEAAIPLVELMGRPPDASAAWAVGVQRIVPGVGFQSWTTPASPDVIPQGFGYLTFGESGQ